jgi:CRISPR-associated exonuclease Cas4
MLGGKNLREMIENAIDDRYKNLSVKIDKMNPDRIHAIEASGCTRFAYYERKDSLPSDNATKVSSLLANCMRHSLSNARGEYKVDAFALEVNVDMVMGNEFIVRFEIVSTLPEVPHPRHMLYLNACLFAFNKDEGFLIYMTAEGKIVEFSVTKNNKMLEEIIRRARVLSTLLKENRVPIVEPSDGCISCKYFERCYTRKKVKDESSGFILEEIFKPPKNNNNKIIKILYRYVVSHARYDLQTVCILGYTFLPLSQTVLPPRMQKSLLSREHEHFFSHVVWKRL